MSFLYFKALHIVFIVTWFAGLFYIVRIFIYQVEANDKPDPDRSILVKEYQRNGKRLWLGITWPSAIITLIFGVLLLVTQPSYLSAGFMHVKLLLVFLLYVYQFMCHRLYRQLQQGVYRYSSQQLRMWNEVATLFLFAIVFIIVLKSTLDMVWGVAGFIGLAVLLFIAIRMYKNYRTK
jgi:putative membrane protein